MHTHATYLCLLISDLLFLTWTLHMSLQSDHASNQGKQNGHWFIQVCQTKASVFIEKGQNKRTRRKRERIKFCLPFPFNLNSSFCIVLPKSSSLGIFFSSISRKKFLLFLLLFFFLFFFYDVYIHIGYFRKIIKRLGKKALYITLNFCVLFFRIRFLSLFVVVVVVARYRL